MTTQSARLRALMTVPARRRGAWILLIVWIVLAVLAFPLATKLNGIQKNDAASYLPSNSESTREIQLEKNFTSQDMLPVAIVYERPAGITPADKAAVQKQVQQVLQDKKVVTTQVAGTANAAPGPIPSKDGKALQVLLPLAAPGDKTLDHSITAIRNTVHGQDGMRVYVSGPAGAQADANKAFEGIDTTLLLIAGLVVVVILLVVYRSPVLWFIPVVSAVVSLLVAQAVIYLFAKYAGLTVNGLSSGILDVLVFGAGTDYALLLVARYREELHRHESKYEAMGFALRRTLPAVFASAATVTLALLCLLLARLNSDSGLGSVAALGIICTFATMSMLLPTLLVLVGRRAFWPFVPRYGQASHPEDGFWSRVGRMSARRPRTVWSITSAGLVILCFGLFSLQAGGLSQADSYTGTPESVQGQRVIDAHFPSGSADPAVIIGPAADRQALVSAAKGTPGIAGTGSVAQRNGLVRIEATLNDPPDSSAAYASIDRLRSAVHGASSQAVVGGQTATNKDVSDAARYDRNLIIPLVLVVVFVILALLLRALVLPLLLMGTVVLSFAAALGVGGFFFAHVFHFGGADTSYPLYVFIFLVALGIDYNIFLMTRVREEVPRLGTTEGTVRGVAVTGGVITSAGVVLAATFAALATLPLVQLVEVGFTVAVGVLLDTFIVRSVLVPALTIDVGPRVWWPSALSRRAEKSVSVPEERVGADVD